MTGWLILLCILGLLAVVLFAPAVLHVTLQTDKPVFAFPFWAFPSIAPINNEKEKNKKEDF